MHFELLSSSATFRECMKKGSYDTDPLDKHCATFMRCLATFHSDFIETDFNVFYVFVIFRN